MTAQLSHIPEMPNLSILEPLDGTYFQYRVCQHPGCNNIVKAAVRNEVYYCPDHAQPTKHGQPLPKKRPEYAPEVTIIFDPLPIDDGGFSAGSRFTTLDFCAMVKNRSVTPGLKARVAGRGVYTVQADGDLVDGNGNRWYCAAEQILRRNRRGESE